MTKQAARQVSRTARPTHDREIRLVRRVPWSQGPQGQRLMPLLRSRTRISSASIFARRKWASDRPERDRGVVAAEAETVGKDLLHPLLAGLVWHVVEVAVGVWRLVVDRRVDDAVAEHQGAGD